MNIIPAILEKEWLEVEKKIKLVDSLTEYIQLDISDGFFTPVETWNNPSDLSGLNLKSKIEVHLMVADPIAEIEKWQASPASRFVVQVESLKSGKPPRSATDKEIVLAFKVETPWAPYADMVQSAGRVLFLSVEAGYQGQEFNESVLEKIKTLKQVMPNVNIEVDGGINLENISKLKELGVDSAVVGSAIFESTDPKQMIERFKNIA
ncbi:MAG: HisA/HisF-related TIM barrel protein [bacterium]|nr:HisA/HisF-related TIM barrel protein [bacterium]